MCLARLNVARMYGDKIISVSSAVLMPKSYCVAYFVYHVARCVSITKNNGLLPTNHSNIRGAAISILEFNKVALGRSWNENNRRVLFPMRHSCFCDSCKAKIIMKRVIDDVVWPASRD